MKTISKIGLCGLLFSVGVILIIGESNSLGDPLSDVQANDLVGGQPDPPMGCQFLWEYGPVQCPAGERLCDEMPVPCANDGISTYYETQNPGAEEGDQHQGFYYCKVCGGKTCNLIQRYNGKNSCATAGY